MTSCARACSLACVVAAVLAPARAAFASDYVVGAGDQLHIEVYGEPSLKREALVPVGCSIDVALIGDVVVCQRTVAQIEADIRTRLGESYIIDPRVIVSVDMYGCQKVEVGGAVKSPGLQVLRGDTPLTEVITAAGGPFDTNVLEVEHVARENGAASVYTLADLDAAPGKVLVRAGDSVLLRRGRQVYVDGEVKEEGPVPFRTGLTVTQAITLAGGPSPYASRRKAIVLTGKGERVEVNLNAVRAGKVADRVLEPDDRITLPRSWF